MTRIKSAFTLIELLVVIAIIAILAAILFPVFAQAKAAAKATVSLSNTKEQALAIIMYSGDSDDLLPLDTIWFPAGATSGAQLCYGAADCFAQWSWVIQPYIKNSQIMFDPLAPNDSRGVAAFDDYYVQYGYNYTYLSPDLNPGAPGKQQSRSQTSFPRIAETIMLAAKYANKENTSGYDWGTGFPGGDLAAGAINVPDCNDIPEWCLDGWGVGSFDDTTLHLPPLAGEFTGGISTRNANQMIAAWLDGHAKKISPGALAIGTTWAPGVTDSNVKLNSNWLQVNLWGDQ